MAKRVFHYYIRASTTNTPVKECKSLNEVRTFALDYPPYFLVQQWRIRAGLISEPTGKTWNLSNFRKTT